MSERRAHNRFELLAQVQVTRESEVHILSTLNISHGGIFLQADPKELPDLVHGIALELMVFSADDVAVGFAAEGTVVRIVPAHLPGQASGFGIKFGPLSPDSSAQLRKILTTLKSGS